MVESNFSGSSESVNSVLATSETAASSIALGFLGISIFILALSVFIVVYNWKVISKTIKEKGKNVKMLNKDNLTLWFVLSFLFGFLAIVTLIFLILNEEWKRLITYIIVNAVVVFVPILVFITFFLAL